MHDGSSHSDIASQRNAMRFADESLARIARLVVGAQRPPALLLDYDGTLTPIVARPEQALLTQDMRERVRRLTDLCPVAVVSGRDAADVRRLVDLPDIIYVGSHGLDIDIPGAAHRPGEPYRPAILRAVAALEKGLAGIAEATVQPKRYAITVHTRLVDPAEKPLVARVVRAVLAGEPSLRYMGGKEMHELRPDMDWHKGSAINYLLADALKGHPPVFIGDDVTDEDGFRAVAGQGLGIRVGDPATPTAAGLVIPDVEAVALLLTALADHLVANEKSAKPE